MNTPGQTTLTAEQAKKACERILKHTPGPWHYEEPDAENLWSAAIRANGFIDKPSGDFWVADVHQQFNGTENCIANCKLIAAAPDMLSALLAAIQVIDDKHVLDMAEAAIDKATK